MCNGMMYFTALDRIRLGLGRNVPLLGIAVGVGAAVMLTIWILGDEE